MLPLVKDSIAFLQEKINESRWDVGAGSSSLEKKAPAKIKEETPPPLPPPPKAPPKKEKTLSLKEQEMSQMRTLISHRLPQLKMLSAPSPVMILYFPEEKEHLPFLEALSTAICEQICPSHVILVHNEKEWKECMLTPFLKLALIAKKGPTHTLEGKILHLAPLEEYQKEEKLKRELWLMLKGHFLPLSS